MKELEIKGIKPLHETNYLNLYDLQYEPGSHYFAATRRKASDIVAIKQPEEFRAMLPDAVSCIVILKTPGHGPRLLLSHEYRHAIGRFLLGVPAGLVDKRDGTGRDAVTTAAIREIKEETGLSVRDTDSVRMVSPLLFSSAGMTDESNALMCIVMDLDDISSLTQDGAEGTEIFDGFELLEEDEAMEMLKSGTDRDGNFYPIQTWAALMYFTSGMWKEE